MAEKSKKVSQYLQDQIRIKLMVPAYKALVEAENAVCDTFFKLQLQALPEAVRPYAQTTYFRTTTYGINLHVRPELANSYGQNYQIQINDKRFLLCPTSGMAANAQTIYENNRETLEPLMFACIEAASFAKTLEKKLSCMLSTLNTTAKLRNEFPEAYEVYVEITNEPAPEKVQTSCDDVEELRALLSKTK